ncbi:MAG: heavy-metal-associated domain-containing protein, partial [Gemmatimonadota bacterium]
MQLDLPIAGLTCLDCARKVERALRALPGVRQASVNYPAGRATVVVDDAADPAALRDAVATAVQAAGYRLASGASIDGASTTAAATPTTSPAPTSTDRPTAPLGTPQRPARAPARGRAAGDAGDA